MQSISEHSMASKVVVAASVSGGVHGPTMSKYIPINYPDLVDSALAATQEGAAVLNIHPRSPSDGSPGGPLTPFLDALEEIAERSGAIINLTLPGGGAFNAGQRFEWAASTCTSLCTVPCGSFNYYTHHIAELFSGWHYEWEERLLRETEANVFSNSFSDLAKYHSWSIANSVGIEFECFDVSHLYNLAFLRTSGFFPGRLRLVFTMGVAGGIGHHPDDLSTMKSVADRLFEGEYVWSVAGKGPSQLRLATQAASMGGNIRVGLDESIYIEPGKLATGAAESVRCSVASLSRLGLIPADPDSARKILFL